MTSDADLKVTGVLPGRREVRSTVRELAMYVQPPI
jgi:hypothetical protein